MTEGVFEYEIEPRFSPVRNAGSPSGEDRNNEGQEQDRDQAGAVILGTLQERRDLVVPETLGGVPVRKIAPHAFSGKEQLRSVSLPRSLRSVGAFALHKCPRLEEVTLYDGITDFHNGVLRRDVRLHRIHLKIEQENYMVMRDILSDTDARLRFLLELPDGEACLLFPGYDYSFEENTMARTIQFTISGAGVVYRECVRRKSISFWEYDRLFRRVVHDDPHAAAEIAADRLLYPYELAPAHAQGYSEYLRGHTGEALLQFVRELTRETDGSFAREAYERIRLLADSRMITGDAADAALREASEAGLTEVCSLILNGRENTRNAQGAGCRADLIPDGRENDPRGTGDGTGNENGSQDAAKAAGTEKDTRNTDGILSLEDW